MRLLHVRTRELKEFFGASIPPYAILSHVWGAEEVTFNDLLTQDHKSKHGYAKINGCCQEAANQGIVWVWVDTCCIDKSSSAELSEAINSMFNWYQNSKICFVYLEDVPALENPFMSNSAFCNSRWWTRGWTLQELLAPRHVVFFNNEWDRVFEDFTGGVGRDLERSIIFAAERQAEKADDPASKQDFIQKIRYVLISGITGIPVSVLNRTTELSEIAAACKFSWAAERNTTRVEDAAYCLLGLLGVNMPLLYGEGDKAFVRLQQAVISASDDISMLSWGCGLPWESIEKLGYESVLTRSPRAFKDYPRENLYPTRRTPRMHATVTGHGLHVELPLVRVDVPNKIWLGIVDEYVEGHNGNAGGIAIALRQKTASDSNTLERVRGCPPIRIRSSYPLKHFFRGYTRKMVYLQDNSLASNSDRSMSTEPGYTSVLRSLVGKDDTKQGLITTELAISLVGFRNAGYILSSQYPPIDHDLSEFGIRSMSKWQLKNGRLEYEQQPFESLLCRAPHERYYFILVGPRGYRVAVKVHIKYKPPKIGSFQILLANYSSVCSGTALEHVCKTGLGLKDRNPKSRQSIWQEHVNLWSKNGSKIHIRAMPSQQDLTGKSIRFAQCDLAWSGGWVDEGEIS
ncbi:HET-domain-containing protein [Periconia macrospinosa]|uniref:HET-domain-containing protein n=1 Tax=Periconia macrospinosa TaxID=97972 RepID=A0A2V1DIH7_9PLEO|nr:HET-domain-containing protein [Periconia macrospinosa]